MCVLTCFGENEDLFKVCPWFLGLRHGGVRLHGGIEVQFRVLKHKVSYGRVFGHMWRDPESSGRDIGDTGHFQLFQDVFLYAVDPKLFLLLVHPTRGT